MLPKKAGVDKKAKVANEVRIPKRAGVAKESWDDKRKLDGEGGGRQKAGVNKES